MGFKKIVFSVLMLIAAGLGGVHAQEAVSLSPAEIKIKLQHNQLLPSIYLSAFQNRAVKDELGKLAKQQVVKVGGYNANFNAAVIYLTDSDNLDGIVHNLTAQDKENVRKYATAAIKIKPTADMYVARGVAIERFLNIDWYCHRILPNSNPLFPYVKQHKQQVRLVLEEYEAAAKIDPSAVPWGSMGILYEALGDAAKAEFCYRMANAKDKKEAEQILRTHKEVKSRFQRSVGK